METGNNPTLEILREQEQELLKKNPFRLPRLELLRIKDKKQSLVPFQLNQVQKKVMDIIDDLHEKKRPVRLVILKGRQFGISTLMESIIYSYTSLKSNVNSLIMSDDDDGSNYLFQMTKLFHEFMLRENPHLTPEKKISNEKKLEFYQKHSQILIDTAANVDAGRKYTFHMAHLSEAARFREFDQTLLSLMQSVPDLPNTFVALETTANGENQFSKFWWQIKKDFDSQQTEWVPIFLSWKDHTEYQRKFFTDSEKSNFVETMTEEERLVMKEHDLTLEQMNWRRYTIKNKCGGRLDHFHAEYPLTDIEAFQTTGRRVFPEAFTRQQEKFICAPKARGEIFMMERRPLFHPQDNGDLKIWKTPQKGHRYVIGSDSSAGLEHGDYACAQVIDRSTWEQVAVIHGHIPPDIFGEKLYALGSFYQWALIAPEVNQDGLVTTLRLRDLYYPQIVHRTKLNFDNVAEITESEELGWQTNVKTKPILMSDLREALTNFFLILHDAETLAEIKKFSVLDVAESGNIKYGAASGHYDDRVMALAIAIHFAKTIPDSTPQVFIDRPNLSTRRTGY